MHRARAAAIEGKGEGSKKGEQMLDWQNFAKAVLNSVADWKALAKKVGKNAGHLRRRVFNNAARGNLKHLLAMDLNTIDGIAREVGLKIPIADGASLSERLEHDSAPQLGAEKQSERDGWQLVGFAQEDKRQEFVETYRDARLVMCLHERLDAWMMPAQMYNWWEREHLLQTPYDWDAREAIAAGNERHRLRSLHTRESSDYYLRVLASEGTFRRAARQKAGRRWLGEMESDVARGVWQDSVGFSISDATRWRIVQALITKRLGIVNWHKIAVVDGILAAYWPDSEHYLYTCDPNEVSKFHAAVKAALASGESAVETRTMLWKIATGRTYAG